MKTVDVGAVLDEGRWTGYQKLLVFGTALAIILDGVDKQLLPNTIPTPIKRCGRPPQRRRVRRPLRSPSRAASARPRLRARRDRHLVRQFARGAARPALPRG